jgi:hypothetical protein
MNEKDLGASSGPGSREPSPTVSAASGFDPSRGSGDFSIGGNLWPGLSKLIEECGEVIQVGGKLMGSAGVEEHWDGTNLRYRIECELADLSAAIAFFAKHNRLSREVIEGRGSNKLATFERWHRDRDRSGEADETLQAAQPEARARAEGIAQ